MAVECRNSVAGGLRVATLTIDHAPANVLDLDHCRQLEAGLRAIEKEGKSRVVILRGSGRFFSTGVDIKQHNPEQMPELLPAFHAVFDRLLDLQAVTIAAVHGCCLGGAAELAMACDRVIAHRETKIGFPEIRVGCYPPVAIAMLAARIGHGRAVEMILGGREIPVETLHAWGIVDRVTTDPGLDSAIQEELALYQDKSPAVLGMAAKLLHDQARKVWGADIRSLEREYLGRLLPHPDACEGIAAFTGKRRPVWVDAAPTPDA
jgi:enoyl-CoA hydratase/carnithine racemase